MSLLSVNVEADGPSPFPCGPWHFQHSSFVKSAFPCEMLSIVTGGSGGILTGSPAFSFSQRAENVLIKATRSARSCRVNVFQIGMLEFVKPRDMALKRSSSVGRVPVGVERHLNVAAVKSRGLGSSHCAFTPLPSPSSPWQPAQ